MFFLAALRDLMRVEASGLMQEIVAMAIYVREKEKN
jgi:hypothetical protein